MLRSSLKDTTTSNKDFDNSSGFKNLNENNESNSLMKMTSSTYDNFKVVIRVRPALQRELEQDLPFLSVVIITNNNQKHFLGFSDKR